MGQKIIVCHIATASGARFSLHHTEEQMRVELIQYYNEALADDDEIEDDAELGEVTDAIEERENVSVEEIWIDPETFWTE